MAQFSIFRLETKSLKKTNESDCMHVYILYKYSSIHVCREVWFNVYGGHMNTCYYRKCVVVRFWAHWGVSFVCMNSMWLKAFQNNSVLAYLKLFLTTKLNEQLSAIVSESCFNDICNMNAQFVTWVAKVRKTWVVHAK